MSSPRTVEWVDGRVRLIDQTRLPAEYLQLELGRVEEVAEAIRTMKVRGAPAIGVTAALGLAQAAVQARDLPPAAFQRRLAEAADLLRGTRPTAVNLFWAIDRVLAAGERRAMDPAEAAEAMLREARSMLDEDEAANRSLGRLGAELLPDGANVLTHCNAGALATVAYGTALGVIRAAVESGKQLHVYVDETRPRLQGMQLTAWELLQERIPATLITDNMAPWLMRLGRIDAVVVGADRIAANGDTANKIGTYGVAVAARAHGIPFYVAAPVSTIDARLESGAGIPIEERAPEEVTSPGATSLAPEGIPVYNPAFDVTPAELITALITDRGVAAPPNRETIAGLLGERSSQ